MSSPYDLLAKSGNNDNFALIRTSVNLSNNSCCHLITVYKLDANKTNLFGIIVFLLKYNIALSLVYVLVCFLQHCVYM